MQKIVIDTNVVVSSMISRAGNPAKIMKLFFERKVDIYYNDAVMFEYEDVLLRPHFKFHPAEVNSLFKTIKEFGIFTECETSSMEMPDEDDRVFYDAAKGCGAFLITGNIRHYPDEPLIVTPAEFLELFDEDI